MAGDPANGANVVDPALRFRTIRTPHFVIHFHQGEDRLAARLAEIAEAVWIEVGQALRTVPPSRTEVVLADQSEIANGWATPIPYNVVFVTAAVPAGSEFIGRTDDWLRLVFTHEFTHVVHLDWSGGWARAARRLFGRTPIAFPNVWLPAWQIEGLATFGESRHLGSGRLHAGDFRAVEREAWRTGRPTPIDRVNGGLTDWPGGLAPYSSGLGFHAYLADRFGEEKLGELARTTAGSVPFFGSRAFKSVYGESVTQLWRQYQADSVAATARMPDAPADSTEQATQLTHRGYVVLGPRFAPPCAGCSPTEIVYSTRDPHEFPSLRAIGVDGSGSRRLAERYLGSTLGVSPTMLVFDQQERHRNVGLYSDLYSVDRGGGHLRRLGHGQRLEDPDLSPDGSTIVCVREERGSRALALVRMAAPTNVDILTDETGTQFNAPRWSPDGRHIVAERHRPGAQTDIVTVNIDSRQIALVATSPDARIVTPTWRPDGRAIVAAADFGGGTFNLFEFTLGEPAQAARQLTFTTGGATWPDVSSDGRLLTFAGYTAAGFDVFVQPYRATAPTPPASVSAASTAPVAGRVVDGTVNSSAISHAASASADDQIARARPYSPWPTLKPTAWAPLVETDEERVRAGALLSGADVLGRHAYTASATWLLGRPGDPGAPSAASPDWQVAYAYDRWQPTLFASASRRTSFLAGPTGTDGRVTPGTLREHEVEAGLLVPVRHVRALQRALVSVVRSRDHVTLATGARERDLLATRLGGSTRTARTFEYAVSPEGGVNVGATLELVRPGFGATGKAATVTVDTRAYLPGLRRHHVVAVRAAGGRSTGDSAARQTFLLGGPHAATDVLDFGRSAFSLLRGFPANRFAGSRVALANLEYRMPLARPQRGIDAWPVFLHTIHATAFVDVGHAWGDRFRRREVKTSLGAELSANIVAGFSFPFTVTGGAAWGHDGARRQESGTVYVRVGKGF